MDKIHLLWIIPVTIALTAVLVHPNLWNVPIGWSPLDEHEVICYEKEESFIKGAFSLWNCSNSKEYEKLTSIKETRFKNNGKSWASMFYCGDYYGGEKKP